MTAPEKKHYRRMLQNVRHGSQVVADTAPQAPETAKRIESVTLLSEAADLPVSAQLELAEVTSPFDYLFGDLAAEFPAHHIPGDPATVRQQLTALGIAMAKEEPAADDERGGIDNSVVPPVYTYWGQFIDHDITANTDRNNELTDLRKPDLPPLDPNVVRTELRNLRQPTLNLDSVYGDGPDFTGEGTESAALYNGIELRIDKVTVNDRIPGDVIPPVDDLDHDLPRRGDAGLDPGATDEQKAIHRTTAVIGDARNDENLIVAQFHVAFLRFHNRVVQHLRETSNGYQKSEQELFLEARDLVRWHYQWLVVHDYLKTIAMPGVVDKVLLDGNRHFVLADGQEPYMPIEFSVAAYRFGHSMVRAVYDYNRNFGRKDDGDGVVTNLATFRQLFAFTGGHKRPFAGTGTPTLPFNWVIEWNRFVDKGDGVSDHFARRIDTRLALPLSEMVNQVSGEDENASDQIKQMLQGLAIRNLLRGYHLSLPTGQAVARKVGARVLTAQELQRGNTQELNDLLQPFLENTPLWFYILKEAEVRCHGNFLGEVGSRIVAETLIGQLRADPESYLGRYRGWNPAQGVRLPNGEPIVTITDLFRFAGVFPADPT
ncbi:peroxidase family protein [Actinoplanes sp. URMC 104]|uniref:peroxidase family protein n=1 Tax=Actinoplanes sp. URMC 104 TaxID=3423409 RepID=UPI003F1BE6BF